MLLWVNGPFGVGKTQTAVELIRRLPGSVLCDPEQVGFGLHRAMPAGLRGDFQDLSAWGDGVYEVLDLVLRSHPGPVVAPMTVMRTDVFARTVGRLREGGHDVKHTALLADRETVLRRLRERRFGHALQRLAGQPDPRGRESFAVMRLDPCLAALRRPEFAEHLETDELTVAQVAERIAASAGLELAPSTDGRLVGRLRRAAVGVRHVRLLR